MVALILFCLVFWAAFHFGSNGDRAVAVAVAGFSYADSAPGEDADWQDMVSAETADWSTPAREAHKRAFDADMETFRAVLGSTDNERMRVKLRVTIRPARMVSL